MIQERSITVEDNAYCVVISDETETLLAARAAGRVPVGLLGNNGGNLSAARYVVESLNAIDEQFLERVVRRELGLPWTIAESDRLLIREFGFEDWRQVLREASDLAGSSQDEGTSEDSRQAVLSAEADADSVFYDPDKLAAYIRNQYGFYEFGLWAVVRKEDGVIVGKAGVTRAAGGADGLRKRTPGEQEVSGADAASVEAEPVLWMEIGYHIFEPYRRRGYALEACRMILEYVHEEFEGRAFAVTKASNVASQKLLAKLGFERCREDGVRMWFAECREM